MERLRGRAGALAGAGGYKTRVENKELSEDERLAGPWVPEVVFPSCSHGPPSLVARPRRREPRLASFKAFLDRETIQRLARGYEG